MSKPANKTMIGAFVLGAVALAVVAVAVFGSGRYFKPTMTYETFFEGSVEGLNLGAPVIFRGVQIGSVKGISLQFQPAALEFHIPVVLEIYPERAKRLGPPPKKEGELLQPLIEKGLRTQLVMQSLITGQMAIALDFFPDEPAKFVSTEKKYPEIPSVPSAAEELRKELAQLPIKEILAKVDSAMTGIVEFVNSGAAQSNMRELEKLTRKAAALIDTANTRIDPLIASLQGTSEQIRTSVANLDKNMTGDKGVLEASRSAMAQAEKTMSAVQQIAQENSAMGQDLALAVEEMARSLRSVRVLSDYAERHPESFLRGKK